MTNRPLYFNLGILVVVVFALGVMFTSYRASDDDLEACPAWSDCSPEKRRTEPGKGVPGEIRAKAAVACRQTVDLGESALAEIDGAQQAVRDWQERYATLPTGEAGKAISGDEALVIDFKRAFASAPPPAYNIAGARQDVERLLAPVRTAAADASNPYQPSPKLSEAIDTERRRAKELRDGFEKRARALDGVLERATGSSRGTLTLKEAIAALPTDVIPPEQLERLAMSPATRDDFRPFLQPGFWQGRRLADASPQRGVGTGLSLTFIKSQGALDNFTRFLDLACNTNNDRPAWMPPKSDAEWALAHQRFNEFRRYVPIWREWQLLPD